MKLTTNAINTASAMLLTMMTTSAEKPGRPREEEREQEDLSEKQKSVIGVIEKAWQDHLSVQREHVELHTKLKLNMLSLDGKTPAHREREKHERSEQEYANGRQGDLSEKIDIAGSEELPGAAFELSPSGETAGKERPSRKKH